MESWSVAVMMLLPVVCHAALASKNEAQPYGVRPSPPEIAWQLLNKSHIHTHTHTHTPHTVD